MKALYLGEKNLGSLGIISIIESNYKMSSVILKNIDKFIEENSTDYYSIGIIDGRALHTSSFCNLKRLSQLISYPVLLLVEENQPWKKYLEQIHHVHGVIKRECEIGFFLNSINVIQDGGYCYSWSVHTLKNDISEVYNEEYYASAGLTRREMQILKMCLEGATNKEISVKLSRSEKTISAHKSNILRKLGIKRFPELFIRCHQNNLSQ
ncbi:LuxR C-terminal-related transcriptional regulator [Trabulsiella odontotermitis]|uniref:helix-turn-helix transcriptional regulator n=1 Tax=Trabulsiella odontotermitis TaxID=379893 RepID=UPI003ACDDC3D